MEEISEYFHCLHLKKSWISVKCIVVYVINNLWIDALAFEDFSFNDHQNEHKEDRIFRNHDFTRRTGKRKITWSKPGRLSLHWHQGKFSVSIKGEQEEAAREARRSQILAVDQALCFLQDKASLKKSVIPWRVKKISLFGEFFQLFLREGLRIYTGNHDSLLTNFKVQWEHCHKKLLHYSSTNKKKSSGEIDVFMSALWYCHIPRSNTSYRSYSELSVYFGHSFIPK